MEEHARDPAIERLDAFSGEWRIAASFQDAPSGRTVFEWMAGRRFLVQRWGFPDPVAQAGIEQVDFGGMTIIGSDPDGEGYLQHYFDSRGVARLYRMSFRDSVWKLWRDSADFSPLDFAQRFMGTFSDDHTTIEGRWEISHDGSTWEHDFDLTYVKVA